MTASSAHAPIRYAPALERLLPDEEATAADLARAMGDIREVTFRDYGHAVRPVHAKSHGLLTGELRVLDGLPAALAQGLFARPAAYPVVLRVSTNPGDVLDDDVSSPRGLAVKVIGVEGERLEGSEGDATQDFVMVNAPAFAAPDTKAFAGNLHALAATTDTGQAWKKAFSAMLRGAEAAVEAVGGKSAALTTLGGHPLTHPLGETFHTTVPFRHGDHVAKYSVAPVSPELLALKDAPVDLAGKPNGLREAVIAFFRDHGGEWELRAQLLTNPETMPVEDASVEWPEAESPHVAVARITVPPQPAWSEARAAAGDDGLSFSPWHGLAAHRPLGSVNRARRRAYAEAASFRAERNRCPIHEPRAAIILSDAPAEPYGRAPGREGRRPNTPDARPGKWAQPMQRPVRHALAGAAGGLVAGAVLSGILAATAARAGEPSELALLERRTADRIGLDHHGEWEGPDVTEEAVGHAGHLVLSAVAGAGYALVAHDRAPPIPAGLAFGLGFYALCYGLLGPALRVTPPPTRETPSNLVVRGLNHLLFGVVTAVVARGVARRL